ncbi:MAG: hypothetical protein DMG09_01450 [Acidobacteria bacterium]|nr:MAG: hypothetical protein DMG09_01450 [Acidobacteriota bacterium]
MNQIFTRGKARYKIRTSTRRFPSNLLIQKVWLPGMGSNTISGGKPGGDRARAFVQTLEAFFAKPLAPQPDDLPSSVEATSDLIAI